MLDADGEAVGGVRLDRLAVEVGVADRDFGGTLDVVEELGDREAPLLGRRGLLRELEDLGVDHDDRVLGLVFLGEVHDDDALHLADLRRGKADARRFVHRLEHVLGERLDLVVDLFDRIGDLAQPLVGQGQDRANGHRRYSPGAWEALNMVLLPYGSTGGAAPRRPPFTT